MGVRVKGFPAWAICRFYHLAWLPGLDRKSRLIADWSVEILFPRDLAEMGQLGHPPRLEMPESPSEVEPDAALGAELGAEPGADAAILDEE